MSVGDLEQVLANRIRQATTGPGQLEEGLDPSTWVARQFLNWWQSQGVEQPLGDARLATQKIRAELERLGGWDNPELGEAMQVGRGQRGEGRGQGVERREVLNESGDPRSN